MSPDHPADQPTSRLSFERSRDTIRRNATWMPGGVSSNFRLNIQPTPLVIERGEGPYLYDIDGNKLIDYYLGMGPMVLGHSPAAVISAVKNQLDKGLLYAATTEIEAEAARLICEMVPSAERVRFNSSGSEAVQAAMRIARGYTGREMIVKFEGHYHGWFDNILWSTSPPPETFSRNDPDPVPGSLGQLASAGKAISVLPWNDLALLEARLAKGDVAGVIMEAAMCNAGSIHPDPGYLEGVRAACDRTGTVLIFDEVITGFRLAPGGAQELFGVTPDLTTMGKAIANGFPVAAVAGKAAMMDLCAGKVLHGGTYNSQPIGMAATVATLKQLTPAFYAKVGARSRQLQDGLRQIFRDNNVPVQIVGFDTVFHVAPGLEAPARDFRDLAKMNRAGYVAFAGELVHRGVRVLERGAWFLSDQHDEAVIAATLDAAADALKAVKAAGKL